MNNFTSLEVVLSKLALDGTDLTLILISPYIMEDDALKFTTDRQVGKFIEKFLEKESERDLLVRLFNLDAAWRKRGGGPNVARELAKYVLSSQTQSSNKLEFEEIHAFLAFNQNLELWIQFLDEISQPDLLERTEFSEEERLNFISLIAMKRAEIQRRFKNLALAKDEILATLESISADEAAGRPTGKSRAGLLYELAYTEFKIGNEEISVKTMHESANFAFALNEEIGGLVSFCVAYRFRFTCGLTDRETYESVLRHAERRFLILEKSDLQKKGLAKRWVMNTRQHLLESAFEANDPTHAIKLHSAAEERKESYPDPRVYMLFIDAMASSLNHSGKCLSLFDEYLADLDKGSEPGSFFIREELSKPIFYAGVAARRLGDMEAARRYFEKGSSMAEGFGNQRWKARCEAAVISLNILE